MKTKTVDVVVWPRAINTAVRRALRLRPLQPFTYPMRVKA